MTAHATATAKPDQPERGPRIELRVSKEDKATIAKKATEAGLTISEFIRAAALGLPVTAVLTEADRLNLIGIGRNLNQALKRANTTGRWTGEIEQLIVQLKDILKQP